MVDFQSINYESEFQEMRCIGRGNFGAAFLVKFKNPPPDYNDEVHFIAKKIILAQLQPKEQEGALLEANLLKNLTHPNIVGYKGTFIDKGVLIIVMEFCEVGDLSFHIKKRKAKGAFFTETEIMNWFVQMCLALEYVHGRKVLHRDIKSSNVFLTRNNTIKLGDFGISKVLENTNDQAMTVQGTPYYMSPEVCQNKPYTYKSDVWALGCILYELCTLTHAFNAENLLGLVYKIVQDQYEPIPSRYSSNLNNLVKRMLTKEDRDRPSVLNILQDEFVQHHMRLFVESKGAVNLNPNLKQEVRTIPASEKTLTQKEEKRLKKDQRAAKDFETMRQEAIQIAEKQFQQEPFKEDVQRQEFIQQSKQTEYNKPFVEKEYLQKNQVVNLNLTGTQAELQGVSQYVQQNSQNTMSQTGRSINKNQEMGTLSASEFSVNERTMGGESYSLSGTRKAQIQGLQGQNQLLGTQTSANQELLGTFLSANQTQNSQMLGTIARQQQMMTPISEKAEGSQMSHTQNSMNFSLSQTQFQNQIRKQPSEEERPIMASGKYDISQFEEQKKAVEEVKEEGDDYSDDFESYESDFESDSENEGFYQAEDIAREQTKKSNQAQQLDDIVQNYQKVLQNVESKSQDHSMKMSESFKNPSQPDNFVPVQTKCEKQKLLFREKLGDQLFNQAHDMISAFRHDPTKTDDKELAQALKEIGGKNRTVHQLLFNLDQLIFMETLNK